MPPLIDLIHSVPETLDYPPAAASLTVTDITMDSRRVRPGSLFAALKGEKTDGTAFIPAAQKAGAVAVLCNKDTKASGIPLIRAANPRKALAHMAAAFYAKQPSHMVAVTGTDGKTSTADFYRQLWYGLGKPSASIGTLGTRSGSGEMLYPESRTTPDPTMLHWQLADLSDKGINYACMEASSHGLHQYRLDGVKLEAGAFTNLGRDHFDYHKTEAEYFSAKSRLFSELLPKGATAVLNQDDARFPELKAICDKRGLKIVGYGMHGEQLKVERIDPTAHGQKAYLELNGNPYVVDVPLVGAFQVMNILAALGLVAASGGDMIKALSIIPKLTGVPGRLELAVRLANGASVFVDYAHTPLALANILKTLRPHAQGKLAVVFGCGGDRDAGKRPEMGKIANELADIAIVTDDNPRSEDAALIRQAVLSQCPRGKEVADRRQAIYLALKGLEAGDILVIAGKGHEKTQTIGDESFPFDDVQVAKEEAAELKLVA